jgi:hypothetical protein
VYQNRLALYKQLEQERGSRLLAYVTGDRQNAEIQIGTDVIDFFVNHLDRIGVTKKISLILYTRGGNTLAAWSLANLIRSFCDELEVIIPSKAHSAGTLMALAADRIVMTKQAALGPIDPSVTTPLNPQIEGAAPQVRVPINVENVNAFLDFARDSLGSDADLTSVFLHLADRIHPVVLGQAHRSRTQIRMLARSLMTGHMNDDAKVDKILGFLCSESGSHDYTINRREAKQALGLPVEKPSQTLYEKIKAIYDDFASELQLTAPYDPARLAAAQPQTPYLMVRGLIESVDGGSDMFVSEGVLATQQIVTPQGPRNAVNDQRTFEGWRHPNA